MIPPDSVATLVEPASNQLSPVNGQASYNWNVTNIAVGADTRYPLMAQLGFDMRQKSEQKDSLTFYSGLFFGIGVPLVIPTLVELYKARNEEKKRDSDEEKQSKADWCLH